MLFERIRRTQKPVFIILAVFFALGFVFFGIGTGSNAPSLADLFGNSSNAAGESIDELQKRVDENPSNANALGKLADQQLAEGQNDEAIASLQRYVVLRPDDDIKLSQLAVLYEERAQRAATRAQIYQSAATQEQAPATAGAASALKLGGGLQNPLVDAAAAPYQQRATELSSKAQADYQQAVAIRRQLVQIDPQSPDYRFVLAQDALSAADYPTALSALEAYLRLEPDAPNKQEIQGVITQLEALVKAQNSSGGSGTGG
jgi:tetratricopeptide (TPR) repeat protein